MPAPAPTGEDPPSWERTRLRTLLYCTMIISLLAGVIGGVAPGSEGVSAPAFIVFAVSLAGLACSAGD